MRMKATIRRSINNSYEAMSQDGRMFTLRISRMPGTLPMTGWPTWLQYLPAPLCGFLMTFDQILFLTGIVDPKDLLYSEEEVDYAKLVKENEEVEGGKA